MQNSIPNNFYLKLFRMWPVFFAAFNPKVNVFSLLSTILYFDHINLSRPLAPLWGKIDICARELLVQNSISNKFYLKLFRTWRVFLAAISPKLNVFCLFITVLYFNHINLSSLLAPFWEIDNRHSRTFFLQNSIVNIFFKLLWSQFWSDFHEIHMVGAGPLMGEPYCLWKQSAQ